MPQTELLGCVLQREPDYRNAQHASAARTLMSLVFVPKHHPGGGRTYKHRKRAFNGLAVDCYHRMTAQRLDTLASVSLRRWSSRHSYESICVLLQRSRRVVSVQTTPSKWRLLNKQCYGVPECMPSIGYSRRLPPVERGPTSPARHLLRSENRLHNFHKRLRNCGHQPRRTTIPGMEPKSLICCHATNGHGACTSRCMQGPLQLP